MTRWNTLSFACVATTIFTGIFVLTTGEISLLPRLNSVRADAAGAASHAPEGSTKPDASNAKSGKEIYRYACRSCHGERGTGKGPAIQGFPVPILDFSDCERMRSKTDRKLFEMIKFGGEAFARSNVMISWQEVYSDPEIQQVVVFIRSLCSPVSSGSATGAPSAAPGH